MIKKNFRFAVCLLMAVSCMNLIQMPVLTNAEDPTKIVVLGDGISTGAQLADGEKSYLELIQASGNYEIQNFAQDNFTTADLLDSLNDAQIQQALSDADVILVSVGIHDIMDQFLVTANGFMEEFGFTQFTDVFTANIEDYGFEDEMELVPYANKMADDVKANRAEAAANMQAITTKLEAYQDARIVYQTVYNLLDNIEMYDTLGVKRKMAYNSIMNPTGTVINGCYNDYLAGYVKQHENAVIADVYSAFAGNAWQYTNLYDLEMHPNAAGHQVIADLVLQVMAEPVLGDVNGDGRIDASDASAILVHAANFGSGLGETLTESQQKMADVDENGTVDSQDAAQIRSYAAASGSGQDYEFIKDSSSGNSEIVDADPNQPGQDSDIVDADPYLPGTDDQIIDADPFAPIML
ncbi:MAG: hypothetical protein K2H82_10785 [Oscillospiraceae bacterium]|nr:hypothetical protein [Oscillospiraceae bacterium]